MNAVYAIGHFINVVVLPLLVAFGLWRWRRRARAQEQQRLEGGTEPAGDLDEHEAKADGRHR